ncbi:C-X-C chemokine receptor type 5 [Centroberyx gerrardi]|uniref:C-X-C chemokine receptor type 5 n=1 Tax=Centroberyx gerrardi TaxID=166262 RepID=UPI003AAF6CC9
MNQLHLHDTSPRADQPHPEEVSEELIQQCLQLHLHILDYSGFFNSSEDDPFENGKIYVCDDNQIGLETFNVVFKPLVYSLVFLLGLVGNGLMLTVLLTRRGPLRITEIYLLHLALADLLLVFTFPFTVAEILTGWVFGEFLCKLVGLLKHLNLLSGTLLLACIGFDRYLAIVHAVRSMQSRRPRTVHLTCMFLWLLCLGLSAPNTVFLYVIDNPTNKTQLTCFFSYHYGKHAHNWILASRLTVVLSFFLSLAVMIYCYTAVVVSLCHSQKSQQKQGAIRLALLVTAVFCLCWLPYNVTMAVETMDDFNVMSNGSCAAYKALAEAHAVTKSLGYSHCCLNPFLYAFIGVRFRNDLMRLLSRWGCRRVCLPFVKAQGHSRSSISDGVTTTSSIYM